MRIGPTDLTPVALLLVAAASAEAQVLQGRVIDRLTAEGIPSASVLVIDPDSGIRAGAITNREGSFHLRTTAGTFQLRIQRVGYLTTGSIPLELGHSDTLSFEVRLSLSAAIPLDSLTITAVTREVRDPSGFFKRQSESIGRFLGPYDVERRRPVSTADLLLDIPGFQVTAVMGGNRVLMTGRNRRCEPTIYVDGTLAHRGTQSTRLDPASRDDGVFLEGLVNPRSIRAMEAYQSGATAPVRFRPVGPIGGGDCGVIVFWTLLGFGR